MPFDQERYEQLRAQLVDRNEANVENVGNKGARGNMRLTLIFPLAPLLPVGRSLQGVPSRQRGLCAALLPLYRAKPRACSNHGQSGALSLVQLPVKSRPAYAFGPASTSCLPGTWRRCTPMQPRLPQPTARNPGPGGGGRHPRLTATAMRARHQHFPGYGPSKDPALGRHQARIPPAQSSQLKRQVNLTLRFLKPMAVTLI